MLTFHKRLKRFSWNAPGVVLAELFDTVPENAPRLTNLSARNLVGTGDAVLIAGFVISGNMPWRMLIRGIGSWLTDFDVVDVLLDPRLEMHTKIDDVDTILAANDDWESEVTLAEMAMALPGALALAPGSKDAVILHVLPAGSFTVANAGGQGAARNGRQRWTRGTVSAATRADFFQNAARSD